MADPNTIASLTVRWVAADLALANAAAVTSWVPRKGAGTLAQATGTAQPSYVAADSTLGGRPSVQFNGTSTFLTSTTATGLGTAQTVIVISNVAGTTQQELVQWGALECIAQDILWQVFVTSALSTSTVASTAGSHVLAYGADATTSDYVYVDGAQKASGDAGSPASSATLRVGNWASGGRFLNGRIAEILAFNAKLPAADLATVDSYAQDTYGIAVSDYVPLPRPRAVTRAARVRSSHF